MQAIEIGCKRCGSEEFRLLNVKTGEVICSYCRNRWIEPSLIEQTETEKFLAEQAKRPQVIVDNTSETDKQLMEMVTKAASATAGGCVSKAMKIVIGAVVALVILAALLVFVVYVGFNSPG
ncbi:MAG: hypothetical protein FWE41_08160 [Coriobacteriia bacterium]|nr:hypothetical protein [Coriobacteriia bacterium]MCL2751038.1 hypothetical protein [Coriobacteriia bacterium]